MNSLYPGLDNVPDVAADSEGDIVVVWHNCCGQDGDSAGIFARRFDSAGSPVGSEFQVNSFTPNAQVSAAKVAAYPDGNFVVVWNNPSSYSGFSYGVFGQRFSSDGSRVGTEFQANTDTVDNRGGPDLAVTSTGEFVVVWNGYPTASGGDVFGQRFASDGGLLGTEFLVNSFITGTQWFPLITGDTSGGFLIAWTSDQLGQGDVFAQRFASSGGPLGAEFRVNQAGGGTAVGGGIASGQGDSWVAVWTSDQDGDQSGIFANRFASLFPDPYCGDGTVNAGEQCDDGNQVSGDCCAADCGSAAVDGTLCDDGKPGTVSACSAGICVGTPFTLDHYKCYQGKDLKNPIFTKVTIETTDQFITTETVEALKLKFLCTPVDKNGEGINDPNAHLACYQVKGSKLSPRPKVEISTQFQENRFELDEPKVLCVPGTKTATP